MYIRTTAMKSKQVKKYKIKKINKRINQNHWKVNKLKKFYQFKNFIKPTHKLIWKIVPTATIMRYKTHRKLICIETNILKRLFGGLRPKRVNSDI